MLLGGLWHGAGWTFVIWGGLHGIYLIINHAWHAFRERIGFRARPGTIVGKLAGRTLTFLAVVVGWVFFRAPDVNAAVAMLAGMIGLNGVALPEGLAGYLGPIPALLGRFGVEFTLGAGTNFILNYLWVTGLFAIAFFLPNSQQFLSRHDPTLLSADPTNPRSAPQSPVPKFRLYWLPTRAWALAMGVLAAVGLLTLNRVTEFLYFQF